MIVPDHSALQHEHAPRPLPLFLALLRDVAAQDPQLARDALRGLTLYAEAARQAQPERLPDVARAGGASLRDIGGTGRPVVLVPSLINPPDILNLDRQVSLAQATAAMGHRTLLLDWGDARRRADLTIAGHVEELLLPLLQKLGEPAALIGYCLGGTMAIAAANLIATSAVVTLAAPWHFSHYPGEGREALQRLWNDARPTAEMIGLLPMEVLQASFWSLDPHRTVTKYSELMRMEPAGAEFRRFVALEDWANEGDALPIPAARELLEDFFGQDLPGSGGWKVGGRRILPRPPSPALHLTASRDRITPAATAPDGEQIEIPAGHVGMVVGRARGILHKELERFLATACR